VKRNSANDSVGSPHVKVGHRQGFNSKSLAGLCNQRGFFLFEL